MSVTPYRELGEVEPDPPEPKKRYSYSIVPRSPHGLHASHFGFIIGWSIVSITSNQWVRNRMPSKKDPQCPAKRKMFRELTTYCMKRKGHVGKHEDMWGEWREQHATKEKGRRSKSVR